MTAEVALPAILGLHHVKVAVSDLPRSRAWYERVLAVQLAVEFRDEGDERIRGVAYAPVGGFTLALRERGDVVATGFDPFAILVADRAAIDGWVERLDALGVQHTPVQRGAQAWKVTTADPDGTEVAFYSAAPVATDGSALDPHQVRPDRHRPPHSSRDCNAGCTPWCT